MCFVKSGMGASSFISEDMRQRQILTYGSVMAAAPAGLHHNVLFKVDDITHRSQKPKFGGGYFLADSDVTPMRTISG